MKTFLLVFLVVVCATLSLFVGVIDISLSDFMRWDQDKISIVVLSRIPRTLSLILAGIGLSICGLIMQQMTQNKFVSPTTAGTLEAAKMGLLIGMFWIPSASIFEKGVFAFLFTFLGSVLFLYITERIRFRNVIFIPLVGLMFGGILNSISTFLAITHNLVQDMNAWMMGDFSGILQGNYELIYASLPAIVLTYLYANQFTVVGMGRDFSKNLGLNYRAVMNLGLFCVSLTVSTIVITAGSITFLGLVVPNLVSLIYGDHIKKTLPYVALWGALFLLVCDLVGRIIIYPFEVPIGLVVGLIGGLTFLILLLRKK